MRKKGLYVVNAMLMGVLAWLGFTSCKSKRSAIQDGPPPINNGYERIKVMYGVPSTIYVVAPARFKKEEPQQPDSVQTPAPSGSAEDKTRKNLVQDGGKTENNE